MRLLSGFSSWMLNRIRRVSGSSDRQDYAQAEDLAHARALIKLDHTKNL